jgi:hypothetical protein
MMTKVRDKINDTGFVFDGEVLDNPIPITSTKAQENPLILFRWKHRVCDLCTNPFDITHDGIFYRCGGCVV